jgi:quercetin dioxygenase-like cupin family protein
MMSIDEIFEHPVLRERVVVAKSAQETGGDALRLEVHLGPRQSIALEHIHPAQKERLTVLAGEVHVRVEGTEWTVGRGQKVEVLPRARHALWNGGDRAAVVQAEFRPALQMEGFIDAFYTLARAGKVSPETGLPRMLEMGKLLHKYRHEIRLVLIPEPVQSVAFAALAAAGQLLDLWTGLRRQGHRAARLRVGRAWRGQ